MVRVFVVFLAAILLGVDAPKQAFPFVNVMPAFWQAWDSTRGQPIENRVEKFKTLVIMPNLAVYANDEFNSNLASDQSIAEYLDSLKPYVPQLRALSNSVPPEVAQVEKSFAMALPDFDPTKVIVYFVPSFEHFNGQTYDFGKRIGVFLGVDGILSFEGTHANVGVDVSHELYHVYQWEMHAFGKGNNGALWQAVWGEGSAAYASRQLTPGATETAALMSRTLANLSTAKTAQLACGIVKNWDSQDGDVASLYLDGGKAPPGLPSRGAYLIGYLAAQDFAKHYTVDKLAKLNAAQVEGPLRADVQTLCAGKSL